MRKLTSLLALCFLVSANALWAGEPDEASAKSETAESMLKKEKTSTSDDDSYKKFRFGGYGEMVASFKDYGINRFFGGNRGNSDDHRNTIAIPRFGRGNVAPIDAPAGGGRHVVPASVYLPGVPGSPDRLHSRFRYSTH